MLPLQLGMATCYQYENAYFPAPYADSHLLCSLRCGSKRSHAFNSASFNTTTRFSSRWSKFNPRIHQKQSQKVRYPKFSRRGACPQTPLRALKYCIYWNSPFQNSHIKPHKVCHSQFAYCTLRANWFARITHFELHSETMHTMCQSIDGGSVVRANFEVWIVIWVNKPRSSQQRGAACAFWMLYN